MCFADWVGVNLENRVPSLRVVLTRVAVAFALAANVYYLGWRASSTLNPAALWLSILLLGAECYGFLTLLLHLFLIWDRRALERQLGVDAEASLAETVLADPPAGLSVDVFIPTLNEPLPLVRNTVVAAREMRYPHATWVLDDGQRPELEEMCRELEVGYLTRPTNEDAKAGNINAALARTSGEFIVVLDADFIPLPNLLERTLGHFGDQGLAFVQLPQTFYNLDSIQHVGDGLPGDWHEQMLFYDALQPGKNRWNAAFWCGSPAVVRRSALESVGGAATGCVTEDILTSMRMHAAGWRSLYHNETLAVGIAPGDLDGFGTQRLRWAQGSMQILRSRENPLLKRGLSVAQRLNYFASMTTYFQAVQLAIYAALPPIVLATGLTPITNLGWSFVERFLPYFLSTMLVIKLTGGKSQRILWDQYFAFLRTFTFLRALPTLLTGGRHLTFKVTAKAPREHPSRRWLYPHLAIAVVNLGAVACIAIEPARTKLTLVTLVVVSTWSVLIAGVYLTVLFRLWNRTYRRRHYRALLAVPVSVALDGRTQRSLTTELSFSGLSTLLPEPLEAGTAVALTLELGDAQIPIPGVVSRSRKEDGRYAVGIEFERIPAEFEALLTEQIVKTTLLAPDHDRPHAAAKPHSGCPQRSPQANAPDGMKPLVEIGERRAGRRSPGSLAGSGIRRSLGILAASLAALLAVVSAGASTGSSRSGSSWASTRPQRCGPTPPKPAAGKVWFGVSLDGANDTVQKYAARLGHTPAVLIQFADLPMTAQEHTWLGQAIDNARQAGSSLLLTLEPSKGLGAVNTPVVEGLVKQVAAAEALGVPVIVRFAQEMNGSWYPWGQQPGAYVLAFRKVADAIHSGAPGAAMLWAPNEGSGYPFTGGRYSAKPGSQLAKTLDTNHDGKLDKGDDPYAPYWPGRRYVDWVGMTIYHWGNTYPWGANVLPAAGKFEAILRGTFSTGGVTLPDFYATYGVGQHLPVAVTETSALYNPSRAGASDLAIKRAWWGQVFASSVPKDMPDLKMINWFEWDKFEQQTNSRIDWTATTVPAIRKAFTAALPSWLAYGGGSGLC